MSDSARKIAKAGYPVQWTTPMGLPVIQPYHKEKEKYVCIPPPLFLKSKYWAVMHSIDLSINSGLTYTGLYPLPFECSYILLLTCCRTGEDQVAADIQE